MHTTNLDLTLEDITKIEGTASLHLKIRESQVTECKLSIAEMRRFFTQAARGRPITNVPHHLARICGTCSNAHLLASLKAIEHGIGLSPSPQTMLLRKLLNYGLIIRDHGLHLYVFALPDMFHRDSILAFDEANPQEHELLHDCFAVKEAGNKLGIAVGGRSVHAPGLRLGGFNPLPKKEDLRALLPVLTEVRPRIIRLIRTFLDCPFALTQDIKFLALVDPEFSYLDGTITTSDGETVTPESFTDRIARQEIPYSQAAGYHLDGAVYMVGALARLNLNRTALHPETLRDAAEALARFPSTNIFLNNLAQAIEMLHAVDASIDLINRYEANGENVAIVPKEGAGVGIIEAPRGTLFHRVEMTADGKVKRTRVIVPTGQNQIGIEQAIRDWTQGNVEKPREEMTHEIEKIIRAYDPCMSCATHFLKIKWQ
jgi:coenzyme F420-reducing hydrogenase alpha subunit